MHVSIKFVVGVLLLLTCVGTMVCAILPSLVNLQHDTVGFAVDAAASIADQVQFTLSGRLRMVRNFGNVLYRAAVAHDLLHNMQLWALIPWCGRMTVQEDLSTLFIRLIDNRGYLVTAYNTINPSDGTDPLAGNVFITNFTSPGNYVDYGFFDLNTLAPANSTNPFTRATTLANYGFQPYSLKFAGIRNASRTAPMQWVSVSPIVVQGSAFSVLSYGGRLVNAADNTTQQVVVNLRGSSLAQFLSVSGSQKRRTGVEVLVDVATSTFVSGSISDPSAESVNGTAALVKLSELQDPRIRPFFHARTTDGNSGWCVILSCASPCTFTFWPHNNFIADGSGGDGSGGEMLDALAHDFVTVRVVEVSDEVGGHGALNMRLVVTVPSNDVVKDFINGFRLSLLIPLISVAAISVFVISLVTVVFRGLTNVESKMQSMSTNVFSGQTASLNRRQTNQRTTESLVNTIFKELQGIGRAVEALSRELYTLRAFTTNTMVIESHNVGEGGPLPAHSTRPSSKFESGPSDEVVTFSSSTSTNRLGAAAITQQRPPIASPLTPQSVGNGQRVATAIPYDPAVGNLRHVPVTTLCGAISNAFLGLSSTDGTGAGGDPALVLRRQCAVLTLLQRFSSESVVGMKQNINKDDFCQSAAGGVHHFFGDRLIVHFNASSRSPKHAISAVCLVINTLFELDKEFSVGEAYTIPVYFGIASSLALCGLMGPAAIRGFTVVAPGVEQAAAMARMTVKVGLPVLMTWRAVEVATQEQQSILHSTRSKGIMKHPAIASRVSDCTFVPVANVVLPHEASKQATTTVYSIGAEHYRKN
jgi:uncharacterized protein YoxC